MFRFSLVIKEKHSSHPNLKGSTVASGHKWGSAARTGPPSPSVRNSQTVYQTRLPQNSFLLLNTFFRGEYFIFFFLKYFEVWKGNFLLPVNVGIHLGTNRLREKVSDTGAESSYDDDSGPDNVERRKFSGPLVGQYACFSWVISCEWTSEFYWCCKPWLRLMTVHCPPAYQMSQGALMARVGYHCAFTLVNPFQCGGVVCMFMCGGWVWFGVCVCVFVFVFVWWGWVGSVCGVWGVCVWSVHTWWPESKEWEEARLTISRSRVCSHWQTWLDYIEVPRPLFGIPAEVQTVNTRAFRDGLRAKL